ncbi:MAG: hypothetical protein LBL83_04695 [Clostridiales bacterium]|nr:hypothetical protein [Clostridiales bacterium]
MERPARETAGLGSEKMPDVPQAAAGAPPAAAAETDFSNPPAAAKRAHAAQLPSGPALSCAWLAWTRMYAAEKRKAAI